MPGLRGYLAGAVGSAADAYARGLAGDSQRQRAQARQVFGAATAAYGYGLPQVSVRGTVRHFPRNEALSINALADPSVQTVGSPSVDTDYTVSWLDLVNGPLVVNVPDTGGRYYTAADLPDRHRRRHRPPPGRRSPLHDPLRPAPAPPVHAQPACGRLKRTRAPAVESAIQIRPPWASMIARESASPRPAPALVRAASAPPR